MDVRCYLPVHSRGRALVLATPESSRPVKKDHDHPRRHEGIKNFSHLGGTMEKICELVWWTGECWSPSHVVTSGLAKHKADRHKERIALTDIISHHNLH
eukprot:94734-Hanusia_phi.AAC.3